MSVFNSKTVSIFKAIIEEASASNAENGTSEQKVGDLYKSYMDMEVRNALGIVPLAPRLTAIDAISDFIEASVLSEEEKGFNQMVLYGRDVSIEDIVSHAKRYPMMAERQVIIVKEAQDLSRTIENLVGYVENPQPTTVLVFCYKYKTLDKRKKLSKAIGKKGILFESKKLYENQVPDWIRRVLAG